jgi:curved DNA-binding protein CbpA
MIDHFAALDLPRRPWVNPEGLKERYHQLAGMKHPDAPSGDSVAFSRVNRAYQILREPAARLRHLLELEFLTEEGERMHIPDALAERFMQVATLQREVDVFLKQQSTATSALTRSLAAGERFAMECDAEKMVAALETDRQRLDELLRVEDSLWGQRDHQTALRLAGLQQEFAYISKWIAQIEEGLLRLRS